MTQPNLPIDLPPELKCRAKIPPRDRQPTPAPIGSGPEGQTCGTCSHCERVKYHDATYLKCELVVWTHSASNDIKKSWPACREWSE